MPKCLTSERAELGLGSVSAGLSAFAAIRVQSPIGGGVAVCIGDIGVDLVGRYA